MTYEKRLKDWSTFREGLTNSQNPLQDVINYYLDFPVCSIYTDPWDPKTWPSPWELIEENEYCEYCIILGMCYTIQLSECFSDANIEIHIGIDEANSSYYYLLYVDRKVLGYDKEAYVDKDSIPQSFRTQKIYHMPIEQ